MNENDVYGLSESKFKFGYFWVSNKIIIKKGFTMFLGLVNLVLLGLFVYHFVIYFFIEWNPHQENMRQLVSNYIDYPAWHKHIEPTTPLFSDIILLSTPNGNYDFLSSIENVNDDWMISLIYHFTANGIITDESEFFIFPNEQKYIFALGVPSAIRPANPELVVDKFTWKRVRDFEDFATSRYQFDANNIKYQSPRTLGIAENTHIGRLSFDIMNSTPYDFWNAGFIITLFSGKRLVGVKYIGVLDLISYESRHVDMNILGSFSDSVKVGVVPDINIYDKDIYRPLSVRFDEEEDEKIVIFSKQLIDMK